MRTALSAGLVAVCVVSSLACCCPTGGPPPAPPAPPPTMNRADAVELGAQNLRQGAKGILAGPWRVAKVGALTDLLIEAPDPPFKRFILRGAGLDGAHDGEIVRLSDSWVEVDGTDSWDGGTYLVVWVRGPLSNSPAAAPKAIENVAGIKVKPPMPKIAEAPAKPAKPKVPDDPRPVLKAGERLGPDDYTHWTKLYGPASKEGSWDTGNLNIKGKWVLYDDQAVRIYFKSFAKTKAGAPRWDLDRFTDGKKAITRADAEERLEPRLLFRLAD